jgi:hypothetical protein
LPDAVRLAWLEPGDLHEDEAAAGMFSMATAADLILPRLLTGEPLTGPHLADLAHGGIMRQGMRFRLPPYARQLPAPTESGGNSQ